MKQSNLASFFGKPNLVGAAPAEAKHTVATPEYQPATGTSAGVLVDGNSRAEKRQLTSSDMVKKPHASAQPEAVKGAATSSRKRLKRVTAQENKQDAQATLPPELEEPTNSNQEKAEEQGGVVEVTSNVAKTAGEKANKAHPFFAKPAAKEKTSTLFPARMEDATKAAADTKEESKAEPKEAGPKPKKAAHPFFSAAGKKEADGAEEASTEKATEAFEAMIKATSGRTAAAKTSSRDGVGASALQAAEQHRHYKVSSYLTWKAGDPTPYRFMAEAFEVIANTTKRQEKASVLIDAFRTILASKPEDLVAVVRLTANELSTPHEGLELGLGESTLKDVLAEASGKQKSTVEKMFQEVGDLGTLAVEVQSKVRMISRPPPLKATTVLKSLQDVAKMEGNKSMDRKKGAIKKLMVACRGNEAGYIMRACQYKRGLRIGVNDSTLLTALAHAVHLHKLGSKGPDLADALEDTAQAVRQAFSECPSYEVLISAMLEHDLDQLPKHCHFIAGVPVKPMLAKPTLGVSEVLDKFSGCEFTCEYKYDGERAQIHVLEDGAVQVYSRNSESSIGKYPDAAVIIKNHLKDGITSIVIDSEVVAVDRATNQIKPFQELSRRSKKHGANDEVKGELCVFPFDCLYLNGEVLLHKPLSERREALFRAIREEDGYCQFAKSKTSSDVEALQVFLEEAVAACTEGLMVKAMDATYEPSKRSLNWLKLKKDYMEGAADSFDVVPIGAWYGKGKRTGFFGSFLLAIYDPETEEFQTISKIGTGFSEEDLQTHTDKLKELVIPAPRSYYRYGDSPAMTPDIWFDAKVVWEVKAADLSISPIHQAGRGLVEANKGISIRFPRLVKERDDKGPEDATSASQVAEMYRNQAVAKANAKPAADDED